jgi:hypothetical protein
MIPDADFARAKAVPIADIAARYTPLKRAGAWLTGPCIFHEDRKPSFGIKDDHWHCFAGCGYGDVIDLVQRAEHLDFAGAVRWLIDLPPLPLQRQNLERTPRERHYDDPSRKAARINVILRECGPVSDGTAARLYLWSRGLGSDHPALLSHAALYCHEVGRPLPAMVAPITASDGRVTAVQRIWCLSIEDYERDPAGWARNHQRMFSGEALASIRSLARSAPDARPKLNIRKKTLGAMLDGAVRLAPAGPILGLAEGVESAVAASILYRIPVWSLCGLSRLGYPAHWSEGVGDRRHWIAPDVPPQGVTARWFDERAPSIWIPPDVRGLWIFGDRGFVGEAVAAYAAGWWRRHGIAAEAILPSEGFGDFADQLLGNRSK